MNQSVCYLILCHNNPEHVKCIIDTLYADDAFFVIHVDKKSTYDFSLIKEDEHVSFVKNRISTTWGDISVVDAVISLSEHAINTFPDVSHYCLISGADFPVKNHKYIKGYLSKQSSVDFIQGLKLPSESVSWLEGGRRRIHAYVIPLNNHCNATIEPQKLSVGNLRQFAKILLTKPKQLLHAFNVFLRYPKRELPNGLTIYGGEMWWILSRVTLLNVLAWNKEHNNYHKFHLDSQVPDEMYFNTLVWSMSDSVSSDIKRYISWGKESSLSPRWLSNESDRDLIIEKIKDPNILFVRKINDRPLVEYIIETIKENFG